MSLFKEPWRASYVLTPAFSVRGPTLSWLNTTKAASVMMLHASKDAASTPGIVIDGKLVISAVCRGPNI
ncbi:hypothetical protein [Candidatus Viadribacter manganicus]|uniref:Uncharacterized protein n=1 Tax=Candidatus Viadribacter manganicus TaxID=1759059 RepID=A0A1B1AH13_9PROT|nr:hypothetical protein [Candidatus Viadribacter manganicus]ANP45848.1 hypothetical protein ATE48_07870 [Candidatus Viadribacter manganicus]